MAKLQVAASQTCTEVSVERDATYCIAGPVCSGSGDAPVGTQCPRAGAVAVGACLSHLPSFESASNTCVLQVDTVCKQIKTGAWGCVISDASSTPPREGAACDVAPDTTPTTNPGTSSPTSSLGSSPTPTIRPSTSATPNAGTARPQPGAASRSPTPTSASSSSTPTLSATPDGNRSPTATPPPGQQTTRPATPSTHSPSTPGSPSAAPA
ncbi:TPA: hypothetical protein N0F65_012689, partial [Lagenidium giganteum]